MRMPAAVALTTLLLVSSIQAEGPDAEFPYSAFAAADATAVRSGPGEQFYPVLGLRRGDAVARVALEHHGDGPGRPTLATPP